MEATVAVMPKLAECCVLFALGYKLRESGVLTGADGQVRHFKRNFCRFQNSSQHPDRMISVSCDKQTFFCDEQTALRLATYVTLPCVIVRALST